MDIGDRGYPHSGQRTWATAGPYDGADELPQPDGAVTGADPVAALRSAVNDAARTLRGGEPGGAEPSLERPPKAEHGDYSSNAAMLLAASLGESPRDVAAKLAA
jgi:hypothetical protein